MDDVLRVGIVALKLTKIIMFFRIYIALNIDHHIVLLYKRLLGYFPQSINKHTFASLRSVLNYFKTIRPFEACNVKPI